MTTNQIIFLSALVPMFAGSGVYMIVRDLPAFRRLIGEVA